MAFEIIKYIQMYIKYRLEIFSWEDVKTVRTYDTCTVFTNKCVKISVPYIVDSGTFKFKDFSDKAKTWPKDQLGEFI